MNRQTLAAIDIGSNAIRLLINYVEQGNGVRFKKAAFVRVPIRLGEDVFVDGVVGREKCERLCEAMQAFAHLMRTFHVVKYRACATSAMREAANSQEVIDRVLACSGIAIEVISGHQEAETISQAGDFSGLMQSDRSYLYMDVGGGSTEITIYSNNRRVVSESFPLGTVRMLSGGVVKKELERFKEWLATEALPHNPVAIIGSGGNINKIQKLLGRSEKEPVRYAEIKALYEQIKELSCDERIEQMGLNTYRADVIQPALKLFLTAAKSCKIDQVIVPRVGLADGIIHELYAQIRRSEALS